jgi:hypothetical protein
MFDRIPLSKDREDVHTCIHVFEVLLSRFYLGFEAELALLKDNSSIIEYNITLLMNVYSHLQDIKKFKKKLEDYKGI